MSDRLEQLYERALTLPDAARSAFVAEACEGDDKLHAELLSLLSAADAAERFFAKLGHAVFAPPTAPETVDGAEASHSQQLRPSHQRESLREGSLVDHYRIVGHIGVGGMGTVYRAHDTRLNREVALKFPAQHLHSDEDAQQRFLVEARAAAALQHPNICVVHEIGSTPDGQPFIAMALCEGDTLKQRLAAGPIEPEQAVAIASQVARALSAAHSRDIIHRDVKPGNIIIAADGTAKLLDFGLAKSSDVTVTRPGSTPGTIAYMSPEQVRGEPLDRRTDLWSLGVVFYEMLTGRRPFRGPSDHVLLQAILHDSPEPISLTSAGVPGNVAAAVERLLRKDRDSRYASAEELLADLLPAAPGRPGLPRPRRGRPALYLTAAAVVLVAGAGTVWLRADGPSAAAAQPAIAVLPLSASDPNDMDLALGMTDELIAMLAKTSGLRVIASTSVYGFRDRQLDVRKIADSLRVGYILEGALQRSGSRLRVRLRLVDGGDGTTSWSDAYDREVQDIFSVQEEIARSVARELGLQLGVNRNTPLRRRPTQNVAAYELYLRGSDPALTRSDSGARERLEYFRQAVALDPNYAAAYAHLATSYLRVGMSDAVDLPVGELHALAEEAALKALALDDSLAEAHHSYGTVRIRARDYAAAEREFKRAVALDPTNARLRESLAGLYFVTGRPREELAEAEQAVRLDPLSPAASARLAHALLANGLCDEALDQLETLAAVRPPLLRAVSVSAQCYALRQRWPEAIAALRPQADRDVQTRAHLGYVLARAGQREEALRIQADLVERWRQRSRGAVYVGIGYAGLGNLDQAFLWLNRAIDDGSLIPSPASGLILEPMFDELHRDPRFRQLKERMGLQKR